MADQKSKCSSWCLIHYASEFGKFFQLEHGVLHQAFELFFLICFYITLQAPNCLYFFCSVHTETKN